MIIKKSKLENVQINIVTPNPVFWWKVEIV